MHDGRLASALLGIAVAAAAQQPTFRTTVPVVVAPATVADARGKIINGLDPTSFQLFDDGVAREFELDTSDTIAAPLAVVVAIQANESAPAALLRVRKIGSMVQALVTGARGRAAVISFGEEIRTIQDFTADADKLSAAFRAVEVQSGLGAHSIDAGIEAARMLTARDKTERRAIILIASSRDRGSKQKVDDLIAAIETGGITVFPVVLSDYLSPWITKPSELPLSPPMPDLLSLIREASAFARTNLAAALAKYSGGSVYSFKTLHGLEQAVTQLGEELHSQYILSFRPRNCSPGFHRIEIRVPSQPRATVRARYGYWTDPEACPGNP